jgi:endonuclease/exonuclease/phosphatase family metal-dependent hydrolase
MLKQARFKFIFILLLLLFGGATISDAQVDTLRLATYNTLKFPGALGTSRIPYFRTVMTAMRPDILVIQELESQAGLLTFLNQVMNSGQPNVYQNAPFVNGPDTDSGLFWKQGKVEFLGVQQIGTDLRNIYEYTLKAKEVTFKIYSLHLKAGSATSDANRRAAEATVLRNYLNNLPANSNFIVAGDFNIYRSTEAAFSRLIENQADNDGQLFDPINKPGQWNNNSVFAAIHTQSTRTTALADSGATGGLDDRFDMMLVSASLLANGGLDVITNSYRAFGNDGRHFNQAINTGTNTVVPDSVATALYFASDHLPVCADFIVGSVTAVENTASLVQPTNFQLYQNHPNPFSGIGKTEIHFSLTHESTVRLEILNLLGARVALLVEQKFSAGEHRVSWDGRNAGEILASGVYFYRMQAETKNSQWSAVKKMLVLP